MKSLWKPALIAAVPLTLLSYGIGMRPTLWIAGALGAIYGFFIGWRQA